jgi:predicted MPP superfamily phosphohydrolase
MMNTLRVLHVSDLHFRLQDTADSQTIIKALLSDVTSTFISKGKRPDLLVFSGDLAFSGEESASFESAWSFLIEPLANICELGPDRIFITPGNHDISREDVRSLDTLEVGFRAKLDSTAAVNAFIDRAKPSTRIRANA